ncbi:MAG: transcriptional repressor LexA [Chloroflexi bacterium]|nr:transcriptional repressor LexA [Chloroflexota bacterium]
MGIEKPLSERQKNILAFISQYVQENHRPPTIREIGKNVKISSTSVVNYNLTKLKEKGYLDRDPEVSRGLRLTQKALAIYGEVVTAVDETISRVLKIKMYGNIVAGEPIATFPDENNEDPIELSSNMISGNPDELFALRVSGDSMIDAMVNDGDIVIMRQANTARNGDMVAAWIEHDEESTLKYFFDEGDKIRLQPANPTMDPIYRDKSSVQIRGKVMMVMRQTA